MYLVIYEYHSGCRCHGTKSTRTSIEGTLDMARNYGKSDFNIQIQEIYKLESDHDYTYGDPPSEGSDPENDPDNVGA